MKEWEKEIPIEVARVLRKSKGETASEGLRMLKTADLKVVTPLSEVRRIASRYSRRYKVPIRISEEIFKDYPWEDALHVFAGGKSVIYLHPILRYYGPTYIKGVIEHEIDHMKVEKRWEEIL